MSEQHRMEIQGRARRDDERDAIVEMLLDDARQYERLGKQQMTGSGEWKLSRDNACSLYAIAERIQSNEHRKAKP